MLFPLQTDDRRGPFNDRFVVQDAEEQVIAITRTGEQAALVASSVNSMRRIKELIRVAEITAESLTVDQLRDAIEGHRRPLSPMPAERNCHVG